MDSMEMFDEVSELSPKQLQHTLEEFGLEPGRLGVGAVVEIVTGFASDLPGRH
jgi:hypothetical protein